MNQGCVHICKVLFIFQQYPMYHVNTTWQQVVPRLNVKGRDLLQVILPYTHL